MDVVIEVAPSEVRMEMVEVVAKTSSSIFKVISRIERVTSIAAPSMGSHSISAVAPNYFGKENALAGA